MKFLYNDGQLLQLDDMDSKDKYEIINPRYTEYIEYLRNHRLGVLDVWCEVLYPNIYKDFDPEEICVIDELVVHHDLSKYSSQEFCQYLDYFYPSEGFEGDESIFNEAWLHHQNVNRHHWQNWVLINDEDAKLVPMDMPIYYVIEMLCDWHSFSRLNPKSTAYKYYQDNKDTMIISEETRRLIDLYIKYLKDPLPEIYHDKDTLKCMDDSVAEYLNMIS